MSIQSLLIANRGEIACRIARTCAQLGVRSVAVYTAADARLPHPARCDAAVEIPDYLAADALVAAAQRAGATAVHPGYGFLSENAGFAQAVLDAGLIWVGPPPSAIAAMGSKAAARRQMAAAGVPVIPGYDGEDQSDAALLAAAAECGYPVLVKASAGGGGKGMAVVSRPEDLPAALASARRLSGASFGDDTLILERYIGRARHVEVQVLADQRGGCVHLYERECSLQRRHQKVIEEAPSPAFSSDDARERLYVDALTVARAVGYQGAGTVEFLLDERGSHYFIEMNTRLQVEHPVTEAITGLDLVALQIAIAEGSPLPFAAAPPRRGWAFEARIYAEDPAEGYRPSTGTLRRWRPGSSTAGSPTAGSCRIDAGVEEGSVVGAAYDPLLAKIVAEGPDRESARRRLAHALRGLEALGVRTNRGQLLAALQEPAFLAGDLHTGFLDQHPAPAPTPAERARAAAAAVAHDWLARRRERSLLPGIRGGWRNNPWRDARVELRVEGEPASVPYREAADGLVVDGRRVAILSEDPLLLSIDGLAEPSPVAADGPLRWVHLPARTLLVEVLPDFTDPGAAEAAGGCRAPMPGKVTAVLVEVGQRVEKGDPLVILESMKMEQRLLAPAAGAVQRLAAAPGQQVEAGQLLVELEEEG